MIVPVRQEVSRQRVEDVGAEVRAGLADLPLSERVRPGARIAVGVGSRGISCLKDVVAPLVEALLALETQPFLIPAMGSHGGGNAEGQRAVLEGYGLGDLGVPILSSMDTVQIGTTPQGMPVYFDSNAAEADGIIVVNRIKEHTAFKGSYESGLFKMLSVGLGKGRGAAEMHNWGIRDAIAPAAKVIIETMPFIGGIGIVENGFHQPAKIAVLPAEKIAEEEPKLLDLARELLPRIPLEPLDMLLIQEMGKDISGTGVDLNVIGMWRRTGGPVAPQFNVVAVLDLTPKSFGNAIGVGHADLISQRLRDKIDLAATYTNCLTSHNYAGGKVPITLPTDREVVMTGLSGVPEKDARLVLVRNTLELNEFWVSEPLLADVGAHPALTTTGEAQPLTFDDQGQLIIRT